LLKRFVLIGLLAGASQATAQASSLKPASPAEIAAAVTACMAAAKPDALDEAALTQAGWQKGTLSNSKGKTVASPLTFYGRKGSNAMLMTSAGKGAASCNVMARIERVDAAPAIVQAISAALKTEPKRDKDNDLYWFAGRTVVGLSPTGKPESPAVRVSVVQTAEKK
jgi:hypothetical protein